MRPLGSVNAYPGAVLVANGRRVFSLGTTLNNALAAYEAGVRPGEAFLVNGSLWEMTPGGGGERTPEGIWIEPSPDTR